MATYNEKYYKRFERDGHVVRLSVLQRGYYGSALEIGGFQSLIIEKQGSQASIEEPIIKSSCVFSMVDDVNRQDTSSTKFSHWEEFYTPDQTLYLIKVSVDSSVIWSGYVTPDSWGDDLVPYGTVSVTARDMVGHMADFEIEDVSEFSSIATDNMASVAAIIGLAFEKASVPMSLSYQTNAHWLTYNSQKSYQWAIDVTYLVGKNWYEAVEGILDSLGLTLQYAGRNIISLASIRDMPLCGYASASSVVERSFDLINLTGHRDLTPAYKRITEKLTYEPHENPLINFMDSDFTADLLHVYFNKEGWDLMETSDPNLEGPWYVVQNRADYMRPNTFGNPFNDEAGDKSLYAILYQMPNKNSFRYTAPMLSPKSQVIISFSLAHKYTYSGSSRQATDTLLKGTLYMRFEWVTPDGRSLWRIRGNQWIENASLVQKAFAIDHSDEQNTEITVNYKIQTPDVPGRLKVWITDFNETSQNAYLRLGNLCVSADPDVLPKGLNVTTNYDEAQNTTLKRNPEFGQVPDYIIAAGAIENGIYTMDSSQLYPPVQNVKWGSSGAALPIAVYVHLQHIAMHAKANNIITGTICDKAKAPNFNSLWTIYDRTFILVGGSYDLLTGYINGATLIEFDDYNDVVGDITADYKYNNIEGQYMGGSAGGSTVVAGGGGGGGVVGSVSSVGVSVPTGFVVSGSPVTKSGTIAIQFASGYSILSAVDRIYLQSAYNLAHSHSNKSVLDGITLEKYIKWESETNKVADIDSRVETLEATQLILHMPRLRIKRIIRNGDKTDAIHVTHPGLGREGYELVLMVYGKHNGRKVRIEAAGTHGRHVKGWGEARGNSLYEGLFTEGDEGYASFTLDELRTHILHNYIKVSGYSREDMEEMSYSTFQEFGRSTDIGFDRNDASAVVALRSYKRFGLAVRMVNPDFLSLVQGDLENTTMDINGVPRYLYSAVAPLDAHILKGDTETSIWFGLSSAGGGMGTSV